MNGGMKQTLSLALAFTLALGLSACGGGGGGGGGTSAFTPVAGSSSTTSDVLSLLADPSSTATNLVLDLSLTNPSVTGTEALSADLTFDSNWMTFTGMTVDANQNGGGTVAAAVDQGDPNRIVIAATKVKAGAVGKLNFTTSGSGNSTQMAFQSAIYVNASGQAIPGTLITGLGGTAAN